MPTCAHCEATIVIGGVRESGLTYCNRKCRDKDSVLLVARRFPSHALAEHVRGIHVGECPKCGGDGPVDVHTSYTVWSFAIFSSWQSHPEVCCRACGIRAKINGMLFSGSLGWWGFPWGVIGAPIQILRNLSGIFIAPDPAKPSAKLEDVVRIELAQQFLDERQRVSEPKPGAAEGR